MEKIEKGNFLLAHPLMHDGYFRKTAVWITEHDAEGTSGFIVGRPLSMNVDKIMPMITAKKFPVYIGGPVAQNQLFFIHQLQDLIADCLPIGNNYYWGGKFEDVVTFLNEGKIKKSQIMFFVGYSGWAPGQLEEEMNENSWIVDKNNKIDFLTTHPKDVWQMLLRTHGTNYLPFIDTGYIPSVN